MKYLSEMTRRPNLNHVFGHPMGLFPSHKEAPRVVVTNGMVIQLFSTGRLGENECVMYPNMAKMTVSYMYIGPQGMYTEQLRYLMVSVK
jgi:urocanate hydratase